MRHLEKKNWASSCVRELNGAPHLNSTTPGELAMPNTCLPSLNKHEQAKDYNFSFRFVCWKGPALEVQCRSLFGSSHTTTQNFILFLETELLYLLLKKSIDTIADIPRILSGMDNGRHKLTTGKVVRMARYDTTCQSTQIFIVYITTSSCQTQGGASHL